ncbi:MAG: hypothetical protein H6718_19990 [Polyangiaceae bacterium]|nr:hypothetical protein [Polyangiaceae bacterium]MCB9605507.1 hypothetical protein [Polyangiaceae bacterium]
MPFTPEQDALLVTAIANARAAIEAAHPATELVGFALMTCDVLCCVTAVGLTRGHRERLDEGEEFVFPEWDCWEEGRVAMEAVDELLHAREKSIVREGCYMPDGVVEEAHAYLTRGLATARERGILPESVYLDVGAPDPSPPLEELSAAAIRLLNPPDVAARALDYLGRQ